MIRTVILTVAALVALSSNAEARVRHKPTGLHPECNVTMPCIAPMSAATVKERQRVARGAYIGNQIGLGGARVKRAVRAPKVRRSVVSNPLPRTDRVAATIISHPQGCPPRAFCGCGAAVRVFGKPVRDLWLARNWFRFPRATPASGMVAVRRHHVFVLETHLNGNTWLAWDANSGGRKTRIHARSIAGYVIVNPHGVQYASAE